jgi:hypothetical protein
MKFKSAKLCHGCEGQRYTLGHYADEGTELSPSAVLEGFRYVNTI